MAKEIPMLSNYITYNEWEITQVVSILTMLTVMLTVINIQQNYAKCTFSSCNSIRLRKTHICIFIYIFYLHIKIYIYKLFVPGHCAGAVLGVTASSKLPVFKECRWGSNTV